MTTSPAAELFEKSGQPPSQWMSKHGWLDPDYGAAWGVSVDELQGQKILLRPVVRDNPMSVFSTRVLGGFPAIRLQLTDVAEAGAFGSNIGGQAIVDQALVDRINGVEKHATEAVGNLSLQVSRLADRVAELNQAFSYYEPNDALAGSLSVIENAIRELPQNDFSIAEWATLFDAAADFACSSPEIMGFALEALSSSRATVRAAAARALANSGNAEWKVRLVQAIEVEKNDLAKTVMAAALQVVGL